MTASEIPTEPSYSFLNDVYTAAGLTFDDGPSDEENRAIVRPIAAALIQGLRLHEGDYFPVADLPDPRGILDFIPVQFRPLEFYEVEERILGEGPAQPISGYRGRGNVVSPVMDAPGEHTYLGTVDVRQRGRQTTLERLRLKQGEGAPDAIFLSPIESPPNPYTQSPQAMNFIKFLGTYLDRLGIQ